MKSCGVIVEYNPLHNGHVYHLQQARKLSGADIIVAVMSGHFLQRGEPSILDKWTRAKLALSAGADLVVELPTVFAVQPADYFARGGVGILQKLQVTDICFGVENGCGKSYQEIGEILYNRQAEFDLAFQSLKNNGESYARQFSEIYERLLPNQTIDFHSPNNVLGIAYAKENATYQQPMKLHPLKRQQANFHDKKIAGSIASATAIREAIVSKNKEDKWSEAVPRQTKKALEQQEKMDWAHYWPLLRYRLLTASLENLKNIYQVTEGIEHRLKEKALSAKSFSDFVSQVKSKRMTWVKIQRICIYILLNLNVNEVNARIHHSEYIRVLGFNQQGQRFLNEYKKDIELPIVTNVHKKNEQLISLDIQAGLVYQMVKTDATLPLDYKRHPIIF